MKANRLVHESSPYLQQHAHNPVDWYPWGDEALEKARSENKPLLVSIGYAACHWCHVMERESFENVHTAEIMNAHFVCIKIDREERPDLDHIYMDAVQAITGSGGWPLNVFLTPEGKPFYGGTYFPPVSRYNLPSWEETLLAIARLFEEKQDQVNQQAENLTAYLTESNAFGAIARTPSADPGPQIVYGEEMRAAIFGNCMKQADTIHGGFGRAPKFPQTFTIQFLLRYFHFTGDRSALDQACLSLEKMICGGIFDQVGGGFSRYSTDEEWLAPHFEKMLYDNALLVSVLSEAYQLTGKTIFRKAIEDTMDFICREMLSAENGFYAALDADSEGEEGKYYVWQKQEISELITSKQKNIPAGHKSGSPFLEDKDVSAPASNSGDHESLHHSIDPALDNLTLFCDYFDISETGNWEGKNILRIKTPMGEFARQRNQAPADLDCRLNAMLEILLQKRQERVPPALDDKILLGWNALFNIACSKAFAALGHEAYRTLAVENMQFLWEKLRSSETDGFLHTFKNGKAKFPAFLDDYASLIQALIQLQEITGDADYLNKAKALTEYVCTHFSDEENTLFYFTRKGQADIIVRKKEIYDGATPSANALMAENLHYLGLVYNRPEWTDRSLTMLEAVHRLVLEYPSSFGMWANFLQKVSLGVNELVIAGKDPGQLHKEVLRLYIPHRILQTTMGKNPGFPLLEGKPVSGKTQVYFCKNYACQAPVDTVELLLSQLEY